MTHLAVLDGVPIGEALSRCDARFASRWWHWFFLGQVDKPADADRTAGRRITCPLLFVWYERDDMADLYGDPAAIWRTWATDVRTASIDCGHHMAEEAPDQLAAELVAFLGSASSPRPARRATL